MTRTLMINDRFFKKCGSLLAILCLLGFLNYSAQAGEIHVSQTQLPVTLGLYLDTLEDPSTELTVIDVEQLKNQWRRSAEAIPTLGFSQSAHWFAVTITGDDLSGKELALSIDAPSVDRIEIYIRQDGGTIQQYLTGDTIPFSEQPARHRVPLVPLVIPNGTQQTQVFFRVTSQSGIELPVVLTTMQLVAQGQESQLAFLGGLFTFFLVCFAACSIIYYFQRDRQFLGHTLFFGGAIVFLLTVTGLGKVWFWGESIELSNRLSYASGTVLIASFCLLGQSLNLESKLRDRAVIVLRFITYAMIPTCLYVLFLPFDSITGGNIQFLLWLGLAVATSVFAMAIFAATQGSRVAVYFVMTWGLLILAYLSLLGYKFDIMEKSSVSAVLGETLVGLAGIALLMSLAEFIRSKSDAFAQANLQAKAKSDFLSNVSKEFLTPVHLILANSKRLMAVNASKLDKPTHQHMTTVIKQSEHLHNLINDLLEMAEIESENFEPHFELIEITHFLAEIKEMMTPAILEKGLVLETQFSSSNLLVQSDRSRLQHVLINLLTNAVKFTDKGSILLGYKAVYFKRKLGIEIFIRDTGRGMSDEFKRRMFQEFSHDEDYSESNPTNTGLGMVIVKRIVEKLGGEIQFESVKNTGSEFFIRLPLRTQKT